MKKALVSLALIAVAGFAIPLRADTLILSSGTRVAGTVVGISDGQVTFKDAAGESRRYRTDEIIGIEFASPDPRKAETRVLALGDGTTFGIQLAELIDSALAAAGQTYTASLGEDVMEEAVVLIPKGSSVQLVISETVLSAGKEHPQLRLQVQSMAIQGRLYRLAPAEVSSPGEGAPVKPRKFSSRFAESTAGGGAPIIRLIAPAMAGMASAVVGEDSHPEVTVLPNGNLRVPAGAMMMVAVGGSLTLQAQR